MTNNEADRIVTEAMGECWHIRDTHYARFVCTKCGSTEEDNPNLSFRPSPSTSWDDYGKVLEWAQEAIWFKDFTKWAWIQLTDYWVEGALPFYYANPSKFTLALAEFILENPELVKDKI